MKKPLPILLTIVTFWLLELTGCKPTQHSTTAGINREIFGSWSDDQGCTATLLPLSTADNNGMHDGIQQLILKSFKDNNHHLFKNITLNVKKYGVITQIEADATMNRNEFSGSYQEGNLLIDTYCVAPLHKVSN